MVCRLLSCSGLVIAFSGTRTLAGVLIHVFSGIAAFCGLESSRALYLVTGKLEREPSRLELVVPQPGETRSGAPVFCRVGRRRRLAGFVLVQTLSISLHAISVGDNCGVRRNVGGRFEHFGRSGAGFRAI